MKAREITVEKKTQREIMFQGIMNCRLVLNSFASVSRTVSSFLSFSFCQTLWKDVLLKLFIKSQLNYARNVSCVYFECHQCFVILVLKNAALDILAHSVMYFCMSSSQKIRFAFVVLATYAPPPTPTSTEEYV